MLDDLGASIALAQQAMSASQPGYGTRVARETFDDGGYPISTQDPGMSFDPYASAPYDPYGMTYDPSQMSFDPNVGIDPGGYPISTQGGYPYDPNVIYDQGGNPMSTQPGDPSGGGGGGWGKTLGNALGGIGRGLAGGLSGAASALGQQARDRIAAQNALKEAIARRGGPSAQTQGGTTQPLNLTGSAGGVAASPLARYQKLLAGLR